MVAECQEKSQEPWPWVCPQPYRGLTQAPDPHQPPLAAHAWVSPLRATPSGDRPTVIRSLSGGLTVRAEPGSAARDSDLLDRRAAAVARLVQAAVGVELALHPAL